MTESADPSAPARPSVDPAEIAKFSAMAAEWWDPTGKFAPLHKFNPVRLSFIRDTAAAHFGKSGLVPFEGLRLLDIGCGGGLLSEPMTRLGFAVTAVDASVKNIKTAMTHATAQGLSIDYRHGSAESLVESGEQFDVVLNMEVVEHVADLSLYLAACAKLVKPGGIMFVATLNKTLKSLALAKIGAEYILRWLPPGTHDWSRFIEPKTLKALLTENGLSVTTTQGVSFDPLNWSWRLSSDTDVNYMVVAEQAR
ncbi:2-polyprenyl-6-hydroxyphenyl methylase/3-demethylubiquinone-9 3-methyltransferase [Rhizomicrobium palustre]|uniref:Ubiquinone biosynthesis O-methyltransferase n=1 Tax=Rhizomicrobium palustre TaxID=189966 RepID=A0A846N450_9PROT|nr:bifunctional 2-polyprenyl-6-hydroxyphenol methylase/3-demethylubiquinol 3-O-methyltransferase UbiG [Rhizomicrobium palustre]NIK90001.1 2-polyprenyl-6-hydroxyphenyl methylase/3-demethylubiquinone-9 3-methyltransferase [Rhizomicrobium palustre]